MSEHSDVQELEFSPADDRLLNLTCTMCRTRLRAVRHDTHPWGERLLAQCDTCGAVIETHTNTKKMRYELIFKAASDSWYPSLKECMDSAWAAFNPVNIVTAVKASDNKKKCAECDEEFVPRKSCVAVRDYCAKCRKDIPKDDDRWDKSSMD